MIKEDRRRKKPFVLYTSDGQRVLGTHSTYKSALQQERAIQVNKARFRANPFTAVDEFETMIDDDLSDAAVRQEMRENYPKSVRNPEEIRDCRIGDQLKDGSRFQWVGEIGRMLKINAEQIVPREDNVFDFRKLSAIARAPEVFNFKIPFYCGYVQPLFLSCCDILEAMSDEDRIPYYTPNSDDVGSVYFQLRDGNHRSMGALLAGESFIYAMVSKQDMQDYIEWIAQGKPSISTNIAIYRHLDANLV